MKHKYDHIIFAEFSKYALPISKYMIKKERDYKRRFILSDNEWKYCLDYFNNKCAYCGKELDFNKKTNKNKCTKDHFDCNKLGILSNCIPACLSCNSLKLEKDFIKWYKSISIYNSIRYIKIIDWVYHYSLMID